MMIEKLDKILESNVFIDFALLFGSYAKGTQTELSDIDIAIHTSYEIDIFQRGLLIAELESHLDKKIDLVILNQLYKTNAKLAFNIIDNHQAIFIHNHSSYMDFKINTLKYFFDMQYTYELFDNALKQRIENGTFGKTQAS